MRDERLSIGVTGLDEVIQGGIPFSSTTLLVGPTGVGKTTLGLSFICDSSEAEPGLIFGFYEDAHRLRRRAKALGLELGALIDSGVVEVVHHSPTELLQDQLAEEIIAEVRRRGVKRLFIDGIEGFEAITIHGQRVSSFLLALVSELRARNVTTIFTQELPYLPAAPRSRELPASALFENIFLLKSREIAERHYRQIAVMKLRDHGYDASNHTLEISSSGLSLGRSIAEIEKHA